MPILNGYLVGYGHRKGIVMAYPQLNRSSVRMEPLRARTHKKSIATDHVSPTTPPPPLSNEGNKILQETANRIRVARQAGKPVVLAFGAHAIKNGLGPVLLRLVERGWLTHLATNGAGVIHDWEFAWLGQSCENVSQMVTEGRFGNWQETGFFINLAINIGAYEGCGYGESVGAMIENECLTIPEITALEAVIRNAVETDPLRVAAAADLLHIIRSFQLAPGQMEIAHPCKQFSIQAGAYRHGVPFTSHPMFGHDIIYNHPMNHGAAIGRAAQRDFLTFAQSISQIDGGVYVSVGSAVMSPMIFEKSLSMAQNLAIQQGAHIDNHFILVSDLAASTWDWSQGEPPENNPAYYLRYNKTFSRMGGTMRYLQADNRGLLLNLLHLLGDPPA